MHYIIISFIFLIQLIPNLKASANSSPSSSQRQLLYSLLCSHQERAKLQAEILRQAYEIRILQQACFETSKKLNDVYLQMNQLQLESQLKINQLEQIIMRERSEHAYEQKKFNKEITEQRDLACLFFDDMKEENTEIRKALNSRNNQLKAVKKKIEEHLIKKQNPVLNALQWIAYGQKLHSLLYTLNHKIEVN